MIRSLYIEKLVWVNKHAGCGILAEEGIVRLSDCKSNEYANLIVAAVLTEERKPDARFPWRLTLYQ